MIPVPQCRRHRPQRVGARCPAGSRLCRVVFQLVILLLWLGVHQSAISTFVGGLHHLRTLPLESRGSAIPAGVLCGTFLDEGPEVNFAVEYGVRRGIVPRTSNRSEKHHLDDVALVLRLPHGWYPAIVEVVSLIRPYVVYVDSKW